MFKIGVLSDVFLIPAADAMTQRAAGLELNE